MPPRKSDRLELIGQRCNCRGLDPLKKPARNSISSPLPFSLSMSVRLHPVDAGFFISRWPRWRRQRHLPMNRRSDYGQVDVRPRQSPFGQCGQRIDSGSDPHRGPLLRAPSQAHGAVGPRLCSMMSGSSTKISVPSFVATAQRCGTAHSRPAASPVRVYSAKSSITVPSAVLPPGRRTWTVSPTRGSAVVTSTGSFTAVLKQTCPTPQPADPPHQARRGNLIHALPLFLGGPSSKPIGLLRSAPAITESRSCRSPRYELKGQHSPVMACRQMSTEGLERWGCPSAL